MVLTIGNHLLQSFAIYVGKGYFLLHTAVLDDAVDELGLMEDNWIDLEDRAVRA